MPRASNAWSHRRHRHPRPPVCKSKDPYDTWPGVVHVFWSHDNFDFDPPIQGAGTFPATRVPLTFSYTTAGISDSNDPWTIWFTIPRLIVADPGLPAICQLLIGTGPPRLELLTGRGEAWPGIYPFTMTGQDLGPQTPNVGGAWNYEIGSQ